MEFTEISEINEMITYSRSLRPTNGIESLRANVKLEISNNVFGKDSGNGTDIYEYEKMLLDSPHNKPTDKLLDKNSAISTLDTLVNLNDKENLDEIIKDIEIAAEMRSSAVSSEPKPKKEVQREKNGMENSGGLRSRGNSIVFDEKLTKESHESKKDFDSQTDLAKAFEKLNEDMISKSYCEAKNMKSFLSSGLKDLPKGRGMTLNSSTMKKGNDRSEYRVYFFKKNIYQTMMITPTKPVSEVIREIIEYYMENKNSDLTLMKYPRHVEAYELRMMEDDDNYQPDFSIPALDKNRIFKGFGIMKSVGFVENPNFKPSATDVSEKEIESKHKIGRMQEIAQQKNKMLVHIIATEANFRTVINPTPDSLIKDLFPFLTLRIKGVNAQNYQFRIYSADPEVRFAESKNFLDPNMPLQNLQTNGAGIELEIVKKKFADDPTEQPASNRNNAIFQETASLAETPLQEQDEGNQQVLYNDVSACHYEEFAVTKTNHRGKRQERIIGIDGFKLYNLSKKYKEQNMGLSGIFSQVFFSKFATKHPERLLKDIKDSAIKNGNMLTITVRTEAGKPKTLEYEAKDRKEANQIVAKLHYLKQLELKQSTKGN
jgi:hypothetical protein